MTPTDQKLLNDRDTILSIVAEHYPIDRQTTRIMHFSKKPLSVETIIHGAWVFAYDPALNVVYLRL